MEKKACIVINENKFEAVYYEGNNPPLNCILIAPDGTTWNNDYLLINTNISVSWKDYYSPRRYKVLKLSYNGAVLFEKNTINKPQLVLDVLNKYCSMSQSQLEALSVESQEKEKTDLEISIEELKTERANLEEQIKIYKEIQTKKEEIKELLSKLDS
jgi:hypothetical protein